MLVELRYLEEKGKIASGITDKIRALVETAPGFAAAFLDLAVADAIADVPRDAVKDPGDRIIAATAVAHRAVLVTKDQKLTTWAGVSIVW